MSRNSLLFLLPLAFASNFADAEIIDGEELRDPTRPFNFTGDEPDIVSGRRDEIEVPRIDFDQNFSVSFIRASSSSPLAVINNRRVTIGDMVQNAQVIGIDREGVLLSAEGIQARVNLNKRPVKMRVAQNGEPLRENESPDSTISALEEAFLLMPELDIGLESLPQEAVAPELPQPAPDVETTTPNAVGDPLGQPGGLDVQTNQVENL